MNSTATPSAGDAARVAGGAVWSILAISNPKIFAKRCRVYADVAREFVRQHPEWRGLKFHCAWIFADKCHRCGNAAFVQLESREHVAQFRVTLEDDGTWTREVVSDRAKQLWER
jgi:hypothetical protein